MSLWVDIPISAYKLGKELGLWDKFLNYFKKKRKILVLGASGVGKSKFVASLAPKPQAGSPGHQRTVNVHKKKTSIEKTPFVLIDTPGQVLDEAKRKTAIADAMRDTVEGIINVVCYGYHEAEEAGSAAAVPKTTGEIAKKPYLTRRRKVELDLLDEWVPVIDDKTAKWILTVVTKADLWWPDTTSEIRDYYQEGEYGRVLEDFSGTHSVMPYCSVIEPFYGNRTSGFFGDHHRDALRTSLLGEILRLSGVES